MSHIAIERGYSQATSRAGFPVSQNLYDKPPDIPTVAIPKSEHDFLLRMSREYHNLKQALYRGGVSEESLETLVNGAEAAEGPQEVADKGDSYNGRAPQAFSHEREIYRSTTTNGSGPGSSGSYGGSTLRRSEDSHDSTQGNVPGNESSDNDGASFPSDEKDEPLFPTNGTPKNDKHQASHSEQRTVSLRGLSDRTTHKDIAAVVRGGTLLDIFLRIRERVASVSFVDGSVAQEFLTHVKRHDLYILGKRVEATWGERQFYLPAHVGVKIYNGASRNLVIRGVNPNITEDMIREDLDHIHNLVVVSVAFDQGNAYISTNSVHNALFARTCMMSRLPYKGMKIEYYPDECAEPLPKIQHIPRERQPTPAKKLNPVANRFQMLNLDGAEDSSDDEAEDEDDMANYPSLGNGLRNGIVA